MGKKKIHMVMIEAGEYTDRRERPYKAFFDKEKAKECVDKISEELRVLVERWTAPGSCDAHTDPELTPLLHAFLYEDVEIEDVDK